MRLRTTVPALLLAGMGALHSFPAEAACDADAECAGGPARIMLILDASSDMLNDGNSAGAMGMTDWDEFGAFVAAPMQSPWEASVDGPGNPVTSHVVHFGLTVLGDAMPAPGEQKIAVEYGPCSKRNVVWATSPPTSCAAPGCTDPWSGPPIEWTFVDGVANDPPGYATPTVSHMPRCDDGPGMECQGSGRDVALAVDLVTDHVADYPGNTDFTVSDATVFANVLFVTGLYDSDDAETQNALERAFAAGVTTYIVGFGRGASDASMQFADQLDAMAGWGSGGTQLPIVAQNTNELFSAMETIVGGLQLPCCGRIDCSSVGGPGDDGGTGGEEANDTWGSASGSGSASDSTDGAASMSGGASMSSGSSAGTDTDDAALDDDGGCTCRSARGAAASSWAWLLLLALRRRRP